MIRLEGVGKVYPAPTCPAVAELDLEIPEGEILVLVGPSGCGKSTTLRLINRMIEPTSGRIIFDGEDVTTVDADQLRRRIGYVIQQIGLFPHQTIAQNIATVPKLLGWDKAHRGARRRAARGHRARSERSTATATPRSSPAARPSGSGWPVRSAADPEVLLMDEPFGAIDPITRDRLQNEFLRLQGELKKTIVFVTHDIDEAIKMGDRIAILGEQSRIAQFDTPERILAYPVDDFVSDFIGSGSTLKGLNFERVRDIELVHDFPVVDTTVGRDEAQRRFDASDEKWMLVLDASSGHRWVNGATWPTRRSRSTSSGRRCRPRCRRTRRSTTRSRSCSCRTPARRWWSTTTARTSASSTSSARRRAQAHAVGGQEALRPAGRHRRPTIAGRPADQREVNA
jgi:osmoprotectant transport system ATP-binding protein